MDFRYPWVGIPDPEVFEAQLARELPRGHVLLGVPVRALAHMEGSDDVLYGLLDGTERVAVVHLTFSENIGPEWPWTDLFSSYSEWAINRMQRDSSGLDA